MRDLYNGSILASQARDASSILVSRSLLFFLNNVDVAGFIV